MPSTNQRLHPNFIRTPLVNFEFSRQETRARIGEALTLSMNFTGEFGKRALPLLQTTVQRAAPLIQTTVQQEQRSD